MSQTERDLVDRHGIRWVVRLESWRPWSAGSISGRVLATDGEGEDILVFQSGGERRERRSFPSEWVDLDDAELASLLAGAERADTGPEGETHGSMICTRCGSRGEYRSRRRGSWLLEILLYVACVPVAVMPIIVFDWWRTAAVAFVPIAYTLGRSLTRYRACRLCLADALIPVKSPVGRQLVTGGRHDGVEQ